jgi:preprotein translocase subunit SecE
MTVEEDAKREREAREGTDASEHESESAAQPGEGAAAPDGRDARDARDAPAAPDERDAAHALATTNEEDHDISPVAPTQLGARRFVYAAYFAGAIAIAFITSKALDLAWLKVQNYQPSIGEPRDEIVMPVSGIIGAGTAVYYWYRTKARQLAEEVAAEMSKVTWPSRTEVTNGTVVVIVTTLVSTVFFALMDKFWGFITNLVYGGT